MGIDTTPYNILLFVHLIAVVVGFGGNFVQPLLARSGNVSDEAFGKAVLYVQLPAVVVMWIAGMGLVGMSDDVWELTQTWILVAIIVFVIATVLTFLVGKAFKDGRGSSVAPLTGALHLSLVVGIYLMIWKPGVS